MNSINFSRKQATTFYLLHFLPNAEVRMSSSYFCLESFVNQEKLILVSNVQHN